jgi:hypothetical protein
MLPTSQRPPALPLRFIRSARYPGDMNYTIRDADHKQHVVSHPTVRSPYLDTEEITRGEDLPVCLQEGRPPDVLASLRRRVDAVRPQYICDRSSTHLVVKVRQSPQNSGVSPSRIVHCHANNPLRDLPHDPRPTGSASTTVVPLLRNQLPMPPHQSIGRHDRLPLQQRLAPDCLSLPSQQCPFRIGESNPLAAEPIFQRPVLSLQELNDEQLTSMDPTRHNGQEKRQQRRHRSHANSLPH